ncbi:MAG: YadA-like family protein [Dialister micraerophilus]|uniref:YadA-like family protein n=1 Tax=Dialister micraerophilus TaxID=309120 RepID=UPI00254DB486|nr:YadA-like family protein [Dialister micraerophilus]MDK8252932.1 YadA-like family protein [Dialister micraerophilus]
MRKIILTGAVLAMLTSAAPMVHAQIPADVQEALNKKVDQDKYNTEITDLKEKANKINDFDGKINNIQQGLDSYKDENDKKVKEKIDENKLQEELTKQKVAINNDVQGKIEQAKNDLEGKITANKNLIQGADGNGGLKGDIKKLQDAVGDNNSGLQKKVNTIETNFEAQRNSSLIIKEIAEKNQNLLIGADKQSGLKKDFEDLKTVVGEDDKKGLQKKVYDLEKAKLGYDIAIKSLNAVVSGDNGQGGLKKSVEDLKTVVGKNENEGLQKAVKENANKITQADNKAESAKAESAAANQLAAEVNRKIEAMANGQNDVKKDIAELGGRIDVTGAMSAALAGLKPLQYDPMAPTQVMGSASTYEGQQAYALGLAHFTSENLMVHGGVSFTNSHKYMANVGVTYKFGHSAEKSLIPMRYQAGPISSIYVMQKENETMREKMAQQEERIAQLEEMIMNMKK